jgi:hypothetical protein
MIHVNYGFGKACGCRSFWEIIALCIVQRCTHTRQLSQLISLSQQNALRRDPLSRVIRVPTIEPLFHCEFDYLPLPHLSQVYDGFEKLRRQGVVTLNIRRRDDNVSRSVLRVVLDGRYSVMYDMQDGLNWINQPIQRSLEFFRGNFAADYYFKRSLNQQVVDYAPPGCKVFPLGLFYPLTHQGQYPHTLKSLLRAIAKHNPITEMTRKRTFHSHEFEFYPVPNKQNRILFLTRLWNPDDVTAEHLKLEREEINHSRVNLIKACSKAFGNRFIGGLQSDSFAAHYAPEQLAPADMTDRASFLKMIRQHNICIATTGLHGSIGAKFAEYVAASRAIISEPLNYQLPGNFKADKHYLPFSDENTLLDKIEYLLTHPDKLLEMMKNNYRYYQNFVKPDSLVLNSLLTVYNLENRKHVSA